MQNTTIAVVRNTVDILGLLISTLEKYQSKQAQLLTESTSNASKVKATPNRNIQNTDIAITEENAVIGCAI